MIGIGDYWWDHDLRQMSRLTAEEIAELHAEFRRATRGPLDPEAMAIIDRLGSRDRLTAVELEQLEDRISAGIAAYKSVRAPIVQRDPVLRLNESIEADREGLRPRRLYGSPPSPRREPLAGLLTDDELALDDLLAAVARQFGRLPEHRPGERDEWVQKIHGLQDQLMSRAATRAYPSRFTPFERRSDGDRPE